MIVDSAPACGPAGNKHTITIDENAISPTGWMTLDLAVIRDIAAPEPGHGDVADTGTARDVTPQDVGDDAILTLGPREMAAAALLRAIEETRGHPQAEPGMQADSTRRASRVARETRALARARGYLLQDRLPQDRLPQDRIPQARTTGHGPLSIPAGAIIPVGGSDLDAFTPAQPFPRDDKPANDNRGRLLLMTALIVGIGAGYAMTAPASLPSREGHEVPAPLTPETRITQMPPGESSLPDGSGFFRRPV